MRTLLAFLPLGLWAAAVLTLGTLENLGAASLPPGSDKVAHFLMYGLGGALAAWAGRRSGHAAAAWMGLVFVVLTGATDELLQSRIPSRSGELMDWVADTAGAVLLFVVTDRLLKKKE